jgi:K+-sensing histidine kinase KdpD
MRLDRAPVSIDALVRDVVEMCDLVAEERGVRLVSSLVPAQVRGDAVRLTQLVANLVDNAIKYTQPGGLVEITNRPNDDKVEIRVRDTGMGIDPNDRPRIFDRLYRGDRSRSQPGLGLGLSFVKAICESRGERARKRDHDDRRAPRAVTRISRSTYRYRSESPPRRGIATAAAADTNTYVRDAHARSGAGTKSFGRSTPRGRRHNRGTAGR